MSDLFGNHIVGFPTRRLKYSDIHLHSVFITTDAFETIRLNGILHVCSNPALLLIDLHPLLVTTDPPPPTHTHTQNKSFRED